MRETVFCEKKELRQKKRTSILQTDYVLCNVGAETVETVKHQA